nr:MAG TPA: hypothetical protein [Caudoviricetes sp.]
MVSKCSTSTPIFISTEYDCATVYISIISILIKLTFFYDMPSCITCIIYVIYNTFTSCYLSIWFNLLFT